MEGSTAPLVAKDDVTTAVNRAFQTIWLELPDYFKRQVLTVSATAGVSSYTLPQNIQEVLGPVRNGLTELVQLTEKSQFLNYNTLYDGGLSHATGSGAPLAYFVERLYQGAAVADNTTVNLLLTPTPDQAYTITYDCSTEAPNYTRSNWCDVPTPEMPIPHNYVESLLLPLARYYLMDSSYFTDYEKAETFTKGYSKALIALGAADPQAPPLSNPKLRESNDDS